MFEIDLAKKKKGEIEDELLLLMDMVDTKKKELSRAEEGLKTSEQRFKTEKADLEGSVGALEEELTEYDKPAQRYCRPVDPTLLRTYDKLRVTRKGRALAGVSKEGSCMACRLQVVPQIVSDVKRALTINTCSYCQRILYWIGDRLRPPLSPWARRRSPGIQQTAEERNSVHPPRLRAFQNLLRRLKVQFRNLCQPFLAVLAHN